MTLKRENSESRGRRSKLNDVYEPSNDEKLLNDYSYVSNTDSLVARSVMAYDNPVREADENRHEYEESNIKNARFSQNVVYVPNTNQPIKIENVRDTGTGKPKSSSRDSFSPHKRHTSCIQVFTLLLSVLAILIGVLSLLMASRIVQLNSKFVRFEFCMPVFLYIPSIMP